MAKQLTDEADEDKTMDRERIWARKWGERDCLLVA